MKEQMKTCSSCGCEKPERLFIINKECKGGYAGVCKTCKKKKMKVWKEENKERLGVKRRADYKERYGYVQKRKEEERKALHPLRVRCQCLRGGMRDRSRVKKIKFDSDYFTVDYLIERITLDDHCECCGKKLDIGFKKNKKFNLNSPSMDRVDPTIGYVKGNVAILCWECNKAKQDSGSSLLRVIANFIDQWKDNNHDK